MEENIKFTDKKTGNSVVFVNRTQFLLLRPEEDGSYTPMTDGTKDRYNRQLTSSEVFDVINGLKMYVEQYSDAEIEEINEQEKNSIW